MKGPTHIVACCCSLVALPARGDIIVPSGGLGTASVTFAANTRFGQSFTATAAEPVAGTVSFRWWPENLALPDPTITVRLREGSGYFGAVLAMGTRTIPDSVPDMSWIDFVFSAPVPLTPGQAYSLDFILEPAVISSGGYHGSFGDIYPGGTRLNPQGEPMANYDLYFRVLTVPAPAMGALLAAGLCALPRRERSNARS